MDGLEIQISYDSLDLIVDSAQGIPTIEKGEPFTATVSDWKSNSKIRKIELYDFVPYQYDPINLEWVINSNSAPDWQGFDLTFEKNDPPTTWLITPPAGGSGVHNLIKFTVKLTFNNNTTFKVDPILDERPGGKR